jgi:hypothetical protein
MIRAQSSIYLNLKASIPPQGGQTADDDLSSLLLRLAGMSLGVKHVSVEGMAGRIELGEIIGDEVMKVGLRSRVLYRSSINQQIPAAPQIANEKSPLPSSLISFKACFWECRS